MTADTSFSSADTTEVAPVVADVAPTAADAIAERAPADPRSFEAPPVTSTRDSSGCSGWPASRGDGGAATSSPSAVSAEQLPAGHGPAAMPPRSLLDHKKRPSVLSRLSSVDQTDAENGGPHFI